jgi:hypothetical protein
MFAIRQYLLICLISSNSVSQRTVRGLLSPTLLDWLFDDFTALYVHMEIPLHVLVKCFNLLFLQMVLFVCSCFFFRFILH